MTQSDWLNLLSRVIIKTESNVDDKHKKLKNLEIDKLLSGVGQ